jgi:hypothetical protein
LGETHLNATFHEPLLVQLIRRLFWIFFMSDRTSSHGGQFYSSTTMSDDSGLLF